MAANHSSLTVLVLSSLADKVGVVPEAKKQRGTGPARLEEEPGVESGMR